MPNETAGERLLARRYRLLAPVGHGGMGTVWHAHDEVLGRDVAVKEVILPHGLTDEERAVQYKRTFREARTAARLGHPGVVTVYDVVEEDGRPWIVMELIRARSLDKVIKQEGPLPVRRAAEIGRQMLAALHAAHEAGVLHRDVKPSNVLVAGGDRAVLTDFGIAVATGDATLTQTGLVMGSPAYIAPERARGKTAGPASDLWSLGVTLYAMVNGRSPFERPEPMASLVAVISEDPPPAPNAGALAPVIEGLLRKDPAERMTAPEAGMLLDDIVRDESSADDSRTRPVPPPRLEPADESERSDPGQRAQAVPVPAEDAPGEGGDPLATRLDGGDPLATRLDSGDPLATRVDSGEGTRVGPKAPVPERAEPAPPATAANDLPTRPSSRTGGGRTVPSRPVLIGVVVVAVLLAISAVAMAMSRNDDPETPAGRTGGSGPARTASASPSAERTTEPTASGSPADRTESEVPEGFRLHRDSTGFAVAVPEDWSGPDREGSSVFFRRPGGGAYVQIDQTDDPGPSALQDWKDLEAASRGSRFPGYQRVKLGPTGDQPPVPDTGDGDRSADWEFTWQSGSTRMHALDRGFVANGRGYAIFLVAPDSEWEQVRRELDPVFRSFRPAE
ncbi:protein kinase domain-containing protein [Thermomonospora cellulosilytica]|uniref:non-specific serine/threonine protein kinase n=1 Tax=Thermomonospora cellulosilytica TaxID=1411118 RepID=A0A7W3N5A0_9ACTN|nr:protein kinase [Thermomonospora cellulosilytica]MBA9007808.1 serine/threonine protein kinase [Thermomonospora cellulosilytica]